MSTSVFQRPGPSEYAAYQHDYLRLVPEGDILELLEQQIVETARLLRGLGGAEADRRYAPGKWSIKEVVGHLADTERIFAYRALRIARGDETPLPGFEQDDYVRAGRFSERSLADLASDFEAVRQASLGLFRTFDAAAVARRGVANNNPLSVRAIHYILAGHERHHVGMIREKYLRR